MAQYYFADDGNWGSADNLTMIDEDECGWTPAEWEHVANVGDNSRIDVVWHLINIYNGDEEHVYESHGHCYICDMEQPKE